MDCVKYAHAAFTSLVKNIVKYLLEHYYIIISVYVYVIIQLWYADVDLFK